MNIDFHAHILPGADHGSRNMETSLKQLAMAKEAGMDIIVATPHFYPEKENISDFLERRTACARKLREAAQGKNFPKVLVGCEAQLCRGMEHIPDLKRLCIEGTNVLLLELPMDYSVRHYSQTLDALFYGSGLRIVLAHIDRYDPTHIDFLLDSGALAQINAEALCHFWSRRRCLAWVRSGAVVALGSDIHGVNIGYSEFLKAKKHLKEKYEPLMKRTEALLPE